MARKLFFGLVWLGLIAFTVASSFSTTQQGDFELLVNLFLGRLSGINPMTTAIFYIMGIFPWVYGAVILFGRGKSISHYPFFIGSMGLGAFALLPYFALRKPNLSWSGEKNWLLKILDSRLMAIIASLMIAVLLVWGSVQGDWSDFLTQWQSSQFIHIMTADFLLLCFLFSVILDDDMQLRGVESGWLKSISRIPLLGALLYWCLRPQLPTN